jgi:ParB family transcriptional regulator, chromosome partitioning protein
MSSMSKNKLALGRGLASLIPSSGNASAPSPQSPAPGVAADQDFIRIQLSLIQRNPFQPRADFSPAALDELRASIQEKGVIQPITVRRIEGGYQLISGERRVRAAREAGLRTIPAFILAVATDEEMLELALIENLQREQLNPIEIGISYRRLMDDCGLTQEEVAQRIGKERSTVTNFLRLLKLPDEIQVAVRRGEITGGHARALLAFDEKPRQMSAFHKIVTRGLSVREVEAMVRKDAKGGGGKAARPRHAASSALSSVEDRLRRLLGTKVQIRHGSGGKGEIVIEYYSSDDLDRLIEVFESINER